MRMNCPNEPPEIRIRLMSGKIIRLSPVISKSTFDWKIALATTEKETAFTEVLEYT